MSAIGSSGGYGYGAPDADPHSDVNKARDDVAKLVAEQMQFRRDNASTAGAQAAAARADVARQVSAEITFEVDKQSMLNPGMTGNGTEYRIAKVKCARCTTTCDIHQSKAPNVGEWLPPALQRVALFGWTSDGDRWFCSGYCGQAYATMMRDHGNRPLPAVERVNDQSYARRVYQDPPKSQAEATTPAAPPVAAQAQPQHGRQQRGR